MFFFWGKWKKQMNKEEKPANIADFQGETPVESQKNARRMIFSGSAVSDVGCVRENNEDNYLLGLHMNEASADHSAFSVSMSDQSRHWHLAGVFDGMGGGERGELASQKTARIFLDVLSHFSKDMTKANVDRLLEGAFLEANNAIVALQSECDIFGTTGTVVCTNNQEFKIFHLGDSRAYLLRENKLFQLTKDQTLAQMKMDAGLYDENAPSAEADKHKLTEYIGRDRTQKNLLPVESEWIPIQKADRLLLCTDGLYDMCSDGEIAHLLQKHGNVEAQGKRLVEAARRNGGADNITCVILAFV